MDFLPIMLFDAKINFSPSILWGIGAGIIAIIGTTVKVLTRNHISKNEVYRNMQSKDRCDDRFNSLIGKIEDLRHTIDTRFDDIKDFLMGK